MYSPHIFASKLSLTISLVLMIDRTYTLMSIFESFSPIVVMLNKVVWDLKVFLLFYVILISLLSIMACVIGYGNTNPYINRIFYDEFVHCVNDLPASYFSEVC